MTRTPTTKTTLATTGGIPLCPCKHVAWKVAHEVNQPCRTIGAQHSVRMKVDRRCESPKTNTL